MSKTTRQVTIVFIFTLLCLLVLIITLWPNIISDRYVLAAQDDETRLMWNCANPDGIEVIGSERIIYEGEVFEVIGDEVVESDGSTFWKVYDGKISADYICEVDLYDTDER